VNGKLVPAPLLEVKSAVRRNHGNTTNPVTIFLQIALAYSIDLDLEEVTRWEQWVEERVCPSVTPQFLPRKLLKFIQHTEFSPSSAKRLFDRQRRRACFVLRECGCFQYPNREARL